MADLVTITPLDDGAFWRVTFGGAKGNILDGATMDALRNACDRAAREPGLRAVLLEGAGAHFSFGASVAEHLPGQVGAMLETIRTLALAMLDCRVVLIACVRGQCLGGGLEVASLCHRIVAHEGARLGQPEIALGVFAPIASVVLPQRLARPAAEDLCLTGRSVTAAEARQMGLVDEVTTDDPVVQATAWARTHFAGRSAAALRLAVEAVRLPLADRLRTDLPRLETLYLDSLMSTHDAVEGLQAFIEKRPPAWRHR